MYRGTVLSIAGSDPSGGAGLQADIKTITALGCYAATCITSITAQNTTGVFDYWDVEPKILEKQITAVLSDIKVDAIKIGMLPISLIENVANLLPKDCPPLILDPVMVATSGCSLIEHQNFNDCIAPLVSKTSLITPNFAEAEIISGIRILSIEDALAAGNSIIETLGVRNVLVKGGEFDGKHVSVLLTEQGTSHFENSSVKEVFHGTGCTLSAAIASFSAQGVRLEEAVDLAFRYITNTIKDAPKIGEGANPVFHNYNIVKHLGKSFL